MYTFRGAARFPRVCVFCVCSVFVVGNREEGEEGGEGDDAAVVRGLFLLSSHHLPLHTSVLRDHNRLLSDCASLATISPVPPSISCLTSSSFCLAKDCTEMIFYLPLGEKAPTTTTISDKQRAGKRSGSRSPGSRPLSLTCRLFFPMSRSPCSPDLAVNPCLRRFIFQSPGFPGRRMPLSSSGSISVTQMRQECTDKTVHCLYRDKSQEEGDHFCMPGKTRDR